MARYSFSARVEEWHLRANIPFCEAFSCRKSTFDYPKCCRGAPNILEMQDCFTVSDTEEWIAFGQRHCCDEGTAAKMWNSVAKVALDGVRCLETCSHQWLQVDSLLECGCEKALVGNLLNVSTLPRQEKRDWFTWLEKVWTPMEQDYHSRRNLTRTIRQGSIEILLHALGLLETVLLSPGLVNEPPPGFPYNWRHRGHFFPNQSALDYYYSIMTRVSKMQASESSLQPQHCTGIEEAEEPVHIALVASVGVPVFGRKAMATVRSALYFACRRKVHFYLFADSEGEKSVREALSSSLESHLATRIAAITYMRQSDMHKAWSIIKHNVPAACVNALGRGWGWTGLYGAPGWMRLFSHEVFTDGPEHVIWVDAGDYVFMADPASMLDEHIAAITSSGAVASFPEGNVFPVQVFALKRMRRASWTEIATRTLRERWRQGNDTRGWLCYRGEGSMMLLMTSTPLFSPISGEWAHEPRCHSFVGAGVKRYFHYEHNYDVWDRRMHSGLITPTHGYVFCAGFAEQVLHVLNVGNCFNELLYNVELAQALALANTSFMMRANAHDGFIEQPVYGGQRIRCGRRILGMHMVRAFHATVPWSVRFLNFWSDEEGLWGRKDDVERKLPVTL